MFKKRFGYEEMMVHVPLCSHKNIKKILVVGDVNDDFKNEIAKHKIENVVYSEDLNIDDKFDIILYNKDIPDELEMANVDRCLEQDFGIFCAKGSFIFKDLEKVKEELATVGKNFWICMPYSFGHNTLIFASKKYHPQAEIVLQTSDLLPDCQYYNTEMQNAAFVHPNYITKEITGIAKR
ncbi:MAG: spermidine synthase [Arcobacteraceae bacterium]|nr:spermidine synthase [Arcobacteraceae bacterium]